MEVETAGAKAALRVCKSGRRIDISRELANLPLIESFDKHSSQNNVTASNGFWDDISAQDGSQIAMVSLAVQ